ncbi:hypothetical protein [Seonamhaeicola sp.]|uniref:hypothetical protein n=1 Tax=Seonamhaeicola sp. TaxID=1912245 RepID=UPI0026017436|nr:hypothetical protein [Seonamhaeicola sp.]
MERSLRPKAFAKGNIGDLIGPKGKSDFGIRGASICEHPFGGKNEKLIPKNLPVDYSESCYFVPYMVKGIQSIQLSNHKKDLITTSNN